LIDGRRFANRVGIGAWRVGRHDDADNKQSE